MLPELARFISRFDRGEYWSAHEELEPAWLRDRRPELQGLIQLAAAWLHAERGNRAGALSKARSAIRLLGKTAAIEGLPLTKVREATTALIATLESSGDVTVPILPPVRLGDLVDASVALPELEPERLPDRVRRHSEGYRIGRDPRLRTKN